MKPDHAGKVAELAERYGQLVFASAYRVLGNAEDADDAFQEVFLRLLDTRNGRLHPGAVRDWGAYLRVAASRCAIDLLRRKRRRKQANEKLAETSADHIDQDGRRLAGQDATADVVRQSLSALSKRDAQVVALRYFEDFSYEEIAAQTGLNVKQVGVILHRGRRRLLDVLQPRMASFLRQRHDRRPEAQANKG